MSRTVRIEVTEEQIAEGNRGDPCRCPVAKAIAKAIPGCGPAVNTLVIHFSCDGSRISTPQVVKDFVNDFDHGHPVKPFEFPLDMDVVLS